MAVGKSPRTPPARTPTPHLDLLVAELSLADEGVKRELARHLRPYLAEHADRLISTDEMAGLLKVHPDTLVRWAREGRIWATKVGKEWRFRADQERVQPAARELTPMGAPPANRRRLDGVTAPRSFAAIRGN